MASPPVAARTATAVAASAMAPRSQGTTTASMSTQDEPGKPAGGQCENHAVAARDLELLRGAWQAFAAGNLKRQPRGSIRRCAGMRRNPDAGLPLRQRLAGGPAAG
jgi:hypothetical protein